MAKVIDVACGARSLVLARWRGLALVGVIALGLASIVGSGGGALVSVNGCLAPGPCVGDFPPEPSQPTVRPPNVTVAVGGSATFSVLAPDLANASYQWSRTQGSRAFVAIAGATAASYTLAGAQLPDDGTSFRAEVHGDFNGKPVILYSTPGRLAVSSMPGVVFQDSEFLASDWVTDAIATPSTNGPTDVEAQVPEGGNPGAWRRTSIVMSNGPSQLDLFHTRQAVTYDPATQGAVYLIEFAQDCLQLPGTLGSSPMFLLEQDGRRFIASSFTSCGLTVWSTAPYPVRLDPGSYVQVTGPACASGAACPDFSNTGKPLHFGYFSTNEARSGISGAFGGFGIDNWKVTVWRH